MLTKLTIRRFKTIEAAEIPLGQTVVFVGPNNSGKTTALQALALWQSGLHAWFDRRAEGSPDKRPGVTVNRVALTHTPVADARLLWHDLRVTNNARVEGKPDTQKVFLDIVVDGDTGGTPWTCGLEFYHGNSESLFCRPLRLSDAKGAPRMAVPDVVRDIRIALLPPMSGLASEEPEVQPGRIAVLLGEGQTAQVLRNLCLQVFHANPDGWTAITDHLKRVFGVTLGKPIRNPIRGSVELGYRQNGIDLDLASAGRGMQQTLLLLAHLHANAGSVLLLDEPDAHLEILRQRQIYDLLTETARRTGSQIVAASHSEVILNEAADRDTVVAFVGRPHRIDDRGSQVLKALKEIGFDQYYQAERNGFVLYLEGATDLAILRGFARVLGHPAATVLDDVFVHYVGNQPKLVEQHFHGLREAKADLVGFAVFDRLDRSLPPGFGLPVRQWRRREIENYLATPDVLLRFAVGWLPDDLVGRAETATRQAAMVAAIAAVESALHTLGKEPWSPDTKVSDDVLPAILAQYYRAAGLEGRIGKSDFHVLTDVLRPEDVDPEVVACLDDIVRHAAGARPATG